MGEFLSMGGYGWYVWGSYAVVLVVVGWQYCAPNWQRRRLLRELRAQLDSDPNSDAAK